MVAVSFDLHAVTETGRALCPGGVQACDERYRLSVEFEDGYRYDRCVACGRAHWVTSRGEIVRFPAS